jgi:cytochrome P450
MGEDEMRAIPVLRFAPQPGGVPPAELRADGRAEWVRAPAGGEPLAVLRRRDEVLQCITSRQWVMAGVTSDGEIRDHPLTGAERQDPDGGLLNMDPPAHRAFRNRINGLFTRAATAATRAEVEAAAVGLASGLRDRTTADLAAEYADPFIATVVCRSLGLPLADWPVILTSSVNAFAPVPGPGHLSRVDDGWQQIYQFYGHVIATGRAHPAGITAQITRALAGFTRSQTVHALANVSNGYPAARQSLRRILWELLTSHRADLDACLRGERDWAGVTDKLLNTVALFPVDLPRRAAQDTWLAGRRFARGTIALPSLVAAAHDPRYPAPAKNIAFGYGPHACPGAALTRLWLTCAVQVFFALYPHAHLTEEEPQWQGDSLAVPRQIIATLCRNG